MRKIRLISTVLFSLFFNQAWAQEAGNFTSTDLPNKTPSKKEELPPVSVNDAPIKPLEINKSTLIENAAKDSIGNLLLNNKVVSLMFDDEQNSNIERALDAFKNNQSFTPELSEEERAAAEKMKASEEEKNKEKEVNENEKSFIYLASIIYFTSTDWAVWINEQKITPKLNQSDKELYLTSVRNDSVKVFWKISLSKWRILSGQRIDAIPPNLNANNQVEIEFELRPNQTFSLKTNKVAEGRALVALLKKKEDEKSAKNGTPPASTAPSPAAVPSP